MASEAVFEGGAFSGRDAEGGEVEDSGEGFFEKDGVVLEMRGLGLGRAGAFMEGRSVIDCSGGSGGGEARDGKCLDVENRRLVKSVREEEI